MESPYPIGVVRALHVGALILAAGGAVFRAAALPGKTATPATDRCVRAGIAAATLSGAVWLLLQAQAFSDAASFGQTLSVLPVVASETTFGRVLLARLGLLFVAGLFVRRRVVPAALACAALLAQPLLGHAGADRGFAGPLVWTEALHLLGAAVWLGGLLPLALVLGSTRVGAAPIVNRFSAMALAAVILIAGSGFVQASALIGSLPGLVGTAYGRVAMLKVALFAVLLMFAAYNRFGPASVLARGDERTASRLRRSVIAELAVGAMVVAAASFLATLPPAIHEQPSWPFGWRPSLVALDDPDLRAELLPALLALAAAALLVVVPLVLRRYRVAGPLVALGLIAYAAPHLDLLLVAAYPTSYATSPNGFSAAAIARGNELYPEHCASCHGATGRGDGGQAASSPVPPADLTAAHLWDHSDGELYWWIAQGMQAPDGRVAMPGQGQVLDSDSIWSLIDDIRANNAGQAAAGRETWPRAIAAPDFDLLCGANERLSDLHGRFVLLTVGPAAPLPGVQAIDMRADSAATCHAATDDALRAYGVLLALAPEAMPGALVLVGPEGVLRRLARPGPLPAWAEPRNWSATVSEPSPESVVGVSTGHHVHH